MNLPTESPAAFITYTFSLLGKIAAADGRVSVQERQRVERYIDHELKLEPKLRQLALEVFESAFDSPLEMRDYAEKFNATFRDKIHLSEDVVELLLCLSIADGHITAEEDQHLRTAALLLGLSLPAYARLREKTLSGAASR